ncbi:MAG: leucine-rich repeat protein [Candidatus Thorarchaeota archaeon]
MDRFNLEFKVVKGEHTGLSLHTGTTRVDLASREILSIDLSPLGQCPQLQQVVLSHNSLEQINLEPLRNCTNLESLHLDWNKLDSIDLNALQDCPYLRDLSLANNQLSEIDLAPLQKCKTLLIVEIDSNLITTIDLQPLSSSRGIKALSLGNNQLASLDLSPVQALSGIQQLNLRSNSLSSIDLQYLGDCAKLQTLDISQNRLKTVNLSPISSCRNLQRLGLSENRLTKIDLTPLSQLTSLEGLWLGNNKLKQVDLAPLANLRSLQDIDLAENSLESLDLSVISSCVGIQRLRLNGNPLNAIDLWPVSNWQVLKELNLESVSLGQIDVSVLYVCTNLSALTIDDSIELLADSLFKFHENPEWLSEDAASKIQWRNYKTLSSLVGWLQTFEHIGRSLQYIDRENWFSTQRGLLDGFSLAVLGGFDGNPADILRLAENASNYAEAQDSIIEGVVDLLEKQFERGGSTLFLDIEVLSETRASRLIPRIHELRENEIEETYIPVVQGMADLRYLWLTNYGFSILSTMRVKEVRMNLRMFRNIQVAMEQIHVTLKQEDGDKKPEPPTIWKETSDGLKEYVFRVCAGIERWR